jgi:hypothetical protein
MKTTYLPNNDSERVVWFNNFNSKLPSYSVQLNVGADDVTQTGKDYIAFSYAVHLADQLKQTQQNATAYKNSIKHADGQPIGSIPVVPNFGVAPEVVPAGVFDRVRMLAQRIKNHPSYTDSIGQDLNIIASMDVTDPNSIQPVLTFKIDVGRPHLKWKKGIAEATDIYADHNDGNGFLLVGRFVRGEYLDTTVLTAGKIADDWKYKAIFVIADEQVGQMSQAISVRAMKQ